MEPDPASFVLASVLVSYPSEAAIEALPLLLEEAGPGFPDSLRALVSGRYSEGGIQDLQSEYISIFDNGRDANPIYETEYDRRRPFAKGGELADIAGFYQAFGFRLDGELGGMEMPDHAGIELEFYALMQMKLVALGENGDAEGVAIVTDAAGKFLKAHLGRFIGSVSRRPGVEASGFYGAVFAWAADLVARECARLDVVCVPADWVESEALKDGELECGVGGGCAAAGANAAAAGTAQG